MKWIISNLKMNLTLPQIIDYESKLSEIESKNTLIVCPSYPYLTCFKNKNYRLGSQNVSHQSDGSITGEVSAKQLKSLNVEYTIIGHSERKEKLLETNSQIAEKLKLLYENDICPILCIGELNKDNIDIEDEIRNNLEVIFKDIVSTDDMIIAYEPVWSVGTGDVASNNHIEAIVKYIKKWFNDRFNIDVKVVYGGSVNTDNIELLNTISDLDGYLLGGTSLDIDSLREIIECMEV